MIIEPIPAAEGIGWLPDDDLTREWLQHVEQYRAECDAADRADLPDDSAPDLAVGRQQE